MRSLWNKSVSEVGMYVVLLLGHIAQKIIQTDWILMRNNSYAVSVNFSVSEVGMYVVLLLGHISQKITQIEWILIRNKSYAVFVKLFSFWGQHVYSTTLRSHSTENHTDWVNTDQKQSVMRSMWNFSVSDVDRYESLVLGHIAQKIIQTDWILFRNKSYAVFVKLFSFWGRHVCSSTLRSHFTEHHTDWVNNDQIHQLCGLCETFQFLRSAGMTPWF